MPEFKTTQARANWDLATAIANLLPLVDGIPWQPVLSNREEPDDARHWINISTSIYFSSHHLTREYPHSVRYPAFSFNFSHKEGRIIVRPWFPQGCSPLKNHDDLTISVSASRSPAAIASDIAQRFLGSYLEARTKALAVWDAETARLYAHTALIAAIQEALDRSTFFNHRDNDTIETDDFPFDTTFCPTTHSATNANVKVTLRLSPTQTLALIPLLRTLPKE